MNKRGIAFILSFMVIAVLTVWSTVYISRSISERTITKRYTDSTVAFWVAEAGLNEAFKGLKDNSSWVPTTNPKSFSGGSYNIQLSDVGYAKQVSVTGTYNNISRKVKGYLLRLPHPFENTVSVGHNLSLAGLLARVEIYGKTRISGSYSNSWGASGWFEDKQEGVNNTYTTIPVPDYNNNGTANEFGDFVLFGQKSVQGYPSDQVVYVQNNGTVNIFPNQSLLGKKVIFVEGSAPGTGNVNIFFDATWRANEDLTIISTGTITYVEPLQFQENSRLSTVSWNNYNEASIFRSQHESVMYAHNNANFVDVLDWGSTTGNVIANNDMSLTEVLTYEKYFYSNRAINGDLPPGFQWLASSSGALSKKMTDWQEW